MHCFCGFLHPQWHEFKATFETHSELWFQPQHTTELDLLLLQAHYPLVSVGRHRKYYDLPQRLRSQSKLLQVGLIQTLATHTVVTDWLPESLLQSTLPCLIVLYSPALTE